MESLILPTEAEEIAKGLRKSAPEQIPELIPDDGTPQNLADYLPEQPEQNVNLGFPEFGTTTATNNGIYTPEEFREKFKSFLEFIEKPETATNCTLELFSNGRNLTADKIYDVASRYSWLNWIIDSKTQFMADMVQIGAFLAIETNLIVMNYTNINLFEKGRIWLKNKVKQKQEQAKQQGKRTLFGWAFSGRPEVAKHTEQNS